jgi:hypothetical protein
MSAEEDPLDQHDTTDKMAEPELESVQVRSQDPASASANQKRKASSPTPTEDVAPKSPKRTKVDGEKTGEIHTAGPLPTRSAGSDRREMALQEEKKRGRRLLGGLMNTLNQASTGSQHRRRQDIERRQQAKSTQQRAEEDRLRMQRLAKLEAVRKVEQFKFDEQVMETKHADMLAKAHYLQTRAKPKIFYRPWDLTRAQKEIVQDQIQEVEKTIEKEVSAFEERKDQRLRSLGTTAQPLLPVKDETVGKPNDKVPADKPQPESTNRPPSRATNKVGPEKESDRVDDVMIEEEEDTVIY